MLTVTSRKNNLNWKSNIVFYVSENRCIIVEKNTFIASCLELKQNVKNILYHLHIAEHFSI